MFTQKRFTRYHYNTAWHYALWGQCNDLFVKWSTFKSNILYLMHFTQSVDSKGSHQKDLLILYGMIHIWLTLTRWSKVWCGSYISGLTEVYCEITGSLIKAFIQTKWLINLFSVLKLSDFICHRFSAEGTPFILDSHGIVRMFNRSFAESWIQVANLKNLVSNINNDNFDTIYFTFTKLVIFKTSYF